MLRRHILLASAVSLCYGVKAEEPFPQRPLKMVVPFAAGGGTDIVARLVAVEMSGALGQPVVVDNRAGAGGSMGADIVAKSRADGYTMLMATVSTHAINPALHAKLPYDPIHSFAPVSLIARVGGVVVVQASSAWQSLGQLAQAMRKDPGKLTFGSQGVGGFSHLMGEMFNSQAGVQSTHVPYKGAAPALQDLLSGSIDIVYDTVPALLPHIQSGKLRALAVTTPQRLSSLPTTPTSAEAGFPDFLAETWNALLAPANTPSSVISRLNDAAARATRTSVVRKRMEDLSAEPVGSNSAELGQFMASEIKRWTPVVRTSGARVE
ncbi:tripartite tricarboxylate transporter substrate binding protein [Variovorax gossypii]|uniref:Tripartite tricarboxylate transporter substrate binding protein n=1 Tax=Variovorax gossypii TaxID=1679495 RepID=A0A431TPD8_9BURK|nr:MULTISPECIES: tripartite tricarboxylate transporter substrate binding protein [Variovorax]MDR6522129.1 tripartite-type tricarboxylate transporter receptor subunit TctC [Variovorax paradoxus]RTQ35571.1 tripartite tricarboxylate transporter substrate binding protein [Variovorax gossypii]